MATNPGITPHLPAYGRVGEDTPVTRHHPKRKLRRNRHPATEMGRTGHHSSGWGPANQVPPAPPPTAASKTKTPKTRATTRQDSRFASRCARKHQIDSAQTSSSSSTQETIPSKTSDQNINRPPDRYAGSLPDHLEIRGKQRLPACIIPLPARPQF